MMKDSARQLFFVINQRLLDGSGHALYCFRHCWWLARMRPNVRVELISPGKENSSAAFAYFGFSPLPNLRLTFLPAIRKSKHGRGWTINLVFYWALLAALRRRQIQPGDLFVTASFSKLFGFLASRRNLRSRLRFIYEVHQLASLEPGREREARRELESISRADLLVTMTGALRQLLETNLPGREVFNAGLACAFSPDQFSAAPISRPGDSFNLGYVGSLYPEQGVEWLIENWNGIREGLKVDLHIIGGGPAEAAKLRERISNQAPAPVTIRAAVPPSELSRHLDKIDGLIIPSLPVGRMPFVAVTKAYDYLGLNRPILASDIKTVVEIIRPEEGFHFQAGNVASLRSALQEMLTSPEEQKRKVAAAAVRAKELSWERRAARWWEKTEQEGSGTSSQ